MDEDKLQALEAEYTRIRDDSRNAWAVVAALFSVAVAIVGALAVVAHETCPNAGSSACTEAPVFWFLAPLAPIAVAILLIQQAALSTIRSTFERALEAEVAALHRVRIAPPADIGAPRELTLPSPSYSRFANRLFDLRRSPGAFRFPNGLLNVIGIVLLGGAVAMSIGELEAGPLRSSAIVVYAGIGLGLTVAALEAINGRKLWEAAVAATDAPARDAKPETGVP